ncbi:MoeA, N-terminal and linker domain-containing protein [Exophiala viscosa]|uniref:MoeA, N-terminal and linker domain-containing protein n=1 Tax=Exophiala viscosa TaxID=2486360 RepID=A0AAN6E135_9EURO|nr:MoeA, N-terminal and linker domain-containing protein [Exophiala viscosa]
MHREMERPLVGKNGCGKVATKLTQRSGSHDAPISYCDAIRRETIIAEQHRCGVSSNDPTLREQVVHNGHDAGELHPRRRATAGQYTGSVQTVALMDALGKPAAHSIKASHSTPINDTSAMDGFAVCSASTVGASPEHPGTLRVVGVVAAGDKAEPERDLDRRAKDWTNDGTEIPVTCVEIMTGAKFPERTYPELDAVIKVEDVVIVEDGLGPETSYIAICAPVRAGQNRRYAGSDIAEGDLIVNAGERIESKHIMALASLGLGRIEVATELDVVASDLDLHALQETWKIGVLSTGSELVDLRSAPESAGLEVLEGTLPDSNGPYICSALREMGPCYSVEHLGVVEDTEWALEQSIRTAVQERCVDVLITTGGVSMGKFDFVRPVVEKRLGGAVVFHGVKVRPGLPVFFAWLDMGSIDAATQRRNRTVLFGLPGNPLAAAMALRFFVVPYLASLHGTAVPISPSRCSAFFGPGRTMSSGLANGEQCCDNQGRSRRKPEHLCAFWLGKLCCHGKEQAQADCVEVLEDQSSYKVGNLIGANCWVEVPEGVNAVVEGDRVTVHPFVHPACS